jgi:hypothetical protein
MLSFAIKKSTIKIVFLLLGFVAGMQFQKRAHKKTPHKQYCLRGVFIFKKTLIFS